MALGWDRRPRSHAPDALAEAVAGVAAITHDPLRHARQASEERDRVGEFMRLPRRDLDLWHAHQGWSEGGLASVIASATERARFAVTVDEGDAWARLALGFAEMFHREHESSVEELRAALDMNPNFALAHACLSLTLAYGGKGRKAVQQIEKAMRLSPRGTSRCRHPFQRQPTKTGYYNLYD